MKKSISTVFKKDYIVENRNKYKVKERTGYTN